MDQTLIWNARINSMVASGKFESATEALEHLNRMSSVTSFHKELDLEQRALSREGKLLGGIVGSARFVELKDDGSAVYKPHDTHEGEKRIELINKERAAYLIDRFLGFNFVPPTVVRELNKASEVWAWYPRRKTFCA